ASAVSSSPICGRDILWWLCSRGSPAVPSSTLLPYTTLFRSHGHIFVSNIGDRVPAEIERYGRQNGERLPIADNLMESGSPTTRRSEEHTSELQSRENLVCRLLLEKNTSTRLRNSMPNCPLKG